MTTYPKPIGTGWNSWGIATTVEQALSFYEHYKEVGLVEISLENISNVGGFPYHKFEMKAKY